jgi:hypothetical protein
MNTFPSEILSKLRNMEAYLKSNIKGQDHVLPLVCSVPYGDSDAFFRYELSDALLEALEGTTERYDAILVDEAQDFDAVWWIGIDQLLRDQSESLLYLFYDDNQNIYIKRPEFPIQDAPLMLCENCRNTGNIFRSFMELYRGEAMPEPIGPPGRAVEVITNLTDSPTTRTF